MSFTSNEYTRVVAAIQSSTFPEETLALLRGMVEQNEGHTVIEGLVAQERVAEQSDEAAIHQTVAKLETLASKSELLGCVLLAILWPTASNYLLHDVCDSIDLWLYHHRSDTLVERLKAVADGETDLALKNHYETWSKTTTSFF